MVWRCWLGLSDLEYFIHDHCAFYCWGAIGLLLGLLLVLTGPDGVIENKTICWVIDKVTSIFRAIPFVILIAILASFTYLLLRTTLGATAALVPLTFATFPFMPVRSKLFFQN